MMQNISILGCTGSIGRQTIAVAQHLGIKVRALSANRNIKLAEEQARLLRPDILAVCDEAAAGSLKISLADTSVRVLSGEESLVEAACAPDCDCVVTAVSGSVGLRPTLAAIDLGRRIALANKETLVCAGDIVMAHAKEKGAEIIPVDSEHSAIFQSLAGQGTRREIAKILLTASGGPFRGKKLSEIYDKTPAEALRHPNWDMGAKITVDSATMMNKGLEFIEAMHLFDVTPDEIEVLVHPQSIIHSAVEFVDGCVVAQLGVPDMGLPIQYALTYPERKASEAERLDLTKAASLDFFAPDLENTPCLALAMECARIGGTAPCIMSAANEEAVGLFLAKKIPFGKIYECVLSALESIDIIKSPTLDDILAHDAQARAFVKKGNQ